MRIRREGEKMGGNAMKMSTAYMCVVLDSLERASLVSKRE